MAPNNLCGESPFSLGSSYVFLHSMVVSFFRQSFIVSQMPNLETLVWSRVVILFQVSLKSVTCRVGAVLHLIIFSHVFLCLDNVGTWNWWTWYHTTKPLVKCCCSYKENWAWLVWLSRELFSTNQLGYSSNCIINNSWKFEAAEVTEVSQFWSSRSHFPKSEHFLGQSLTWMMS